MRPVRVRIGKIMLQLPNMTAADGPRLGRMIAQQLQGMIAAGGSPRLQSVAGVRVQIPFVAGAPAPFADTATAIAQGIHQAIVPKR